MPDRKKWLSKTKDIFRSGRKKKKDDNPQGDSGASSPSAISATDLIPAPRTSAPASEPAKITSVTAIIAQSSLGQIVPPVSQSLVPTAASPALSALPAVSPTAEPSTLGADTWRRAYEIVRAREPELMEDYRRHLASLQANASAHADLSTPRSVECIMEQLLEHREKKQWRVSLLGRDIKIREQVEKLAKFLVWSDSVVKNALSAQPHAALAWSGVSLLLPLLTSGTTQNEAMLKGFNSITELQMYWRICEEAYLQSEHRKSYRELVRPLSELYARVIEYQARAICHLSSAQLSRAWQNVAGWNDWDAKAQDVDKQSKTCKDYVSHSQAEKITEHWSCQLQEMQQSRTILQEIRQALDNGGRQTQTNYKDQKERDLLQVLASEYEDHKNFNPQRVEGTCEWFFNDDRFLQWRDSRKSSLLWVSAGPGCGKSVLSRALIDEHRLSTNITTSTICYFFFKDGDERRMRSTNSLCAILHQLLTQNLSGSTLIGNALPSHKHYGNGLAQNFSELWRIIVECAGSSDTEEVICILDALDECEKNSREQLIGKLKDFYRGQHNVSRSKLKFLITSRPYDDLEAYFGGFSATNYLRFDGDDKSADISREINLVIDERVNKVLARSTSDAQRKLSDRLKSMENRTYLWLYLIFDIIEEKLSWFTKLSSIEELLSEIPSRVSEAYEKILSRSPDEAHTEILLRIILGSVPFPCSTRVRPMATRWI
ncbi:putative ankyrin repeat-containing domain [Rosellinia necatrix]|uniref:Putative ankyrin repeat-containing domain n=1 Tax=Rosellinia necatrix TaxID=77044 RepID=A0A1W2TSQ0_ROSNE|nr:putative ankyrin repeat-containing domain [Rosellinia necatrix]